MPPIIGRMFCFCTRLRPAAAKRRKKNSRPKAKRKRQKKRHGRHYFSPIFQRWKNKERSDWRMQRRLLFYFSAEFFLFCRFFYSLKNNGRRRRLFSAANNCALRKIRRLFVLLFNLAGFYFNFPTRDFYRPEAKQDAVTRDKFIIQ